ncbi:hypothetical protein CBM2587_A10107 [Cupriavidus taiwanensis]|uniref:Uncharacterized protein n=1 Tax=Cupriavidus taiwanensis TaxID=164546 RepID=A0A975WQP5_9BURK|nr:hypothetical protein CBM2587_A10107 [Cupriavidus taiwanensis]
MSDNRAPVRETVRGTQMATDPSQARAAGERGRSGWGRIVVSEGPHQGQKKQAERKRPEGFLQN